MNSIKMTSNQQGDEDFAIIGAGLSRTGTQTLKSVLQDLLGKPCYHMTEVMTTKPHHMDFWCSVLKGEKKDKEEWKDILKGYGAGVDMPICLFYKELMEVYPDAKVLMSVRDPEKWYESFLNTAVSVTKSLNTWRGHFSFVIVNPKLKKFPEFSRNILTAFLGDNWEKEKKEEYLYRYRKHIEEVKRIVPEEKLLIFDVRDGYAPLCKFLGVPIREGNLPKLNDSNFFRRRMMIRKIASCGIVIGIISLIGICTWFIYFFLKLSEN